MRRLIGVLLCAGPMLALTACERLALDQQLKELCRKDGHVKIYETVTLPKQAFDQNNNVLQSTTAINGQATTVVAGAYSVKFQFFVLKAGDPLKGQGLLQRQSSQIIRISDGRVMAESVQYVRAGGDGLHIGHHTTNTCPLMDGGLVQMVFIKQI
jgi:hypothetical protein